MNLIHTYTEGKYKINKKNNLKLSEFISNLSVGALNKYLPEFVQPEL